MSAHTPGPWREHPNERGAIRDCRYPDSPGACAYIAEVALPRSDEGIANARLIAAAPELLGMLRRLAEAAERFPDLAPLAAECALAVCRAEGDTAFADRLLGIAQAEGRQ